MASGSSPAVTMWSTARRLRAVMHWRTMNLDGCRGLGSSLRFFHDSPRMCPDSQPFEATLLHPFIKLHPAQPSLVQAFTQLANAELVSDQEKDPSACFLRLPDAFKKMWGYRKDLAADIYKRDCYNELVAFVTNHLGHPKGDGVVITGTPGIGKTGFLFYLLWCSLRSGRDVVLAVHGLYHVVLFEGKKLGVARTDNIHAVADVFERRSPWPWLLADKVVPEACRLYDFKVLLTSSPRMAKASELTKMSSVKQVYVPTWTEEELYKLNRQVFSLQDKEVKERFFKWGGVPRFVLDRIEDKQRLGTAITLTARMDLTSLCFDEKMNAIAFPEDKNMNAIAIPEDMSFKIFHCNPVDGDITDVRYSLASAYVVAELVKWKPKSSLENFLNTPVEDELHDIQAQVWQHYVIAYLEMGGDLKVRTPAGVESIITTPRPIGILRVPPKGIKEKEIAVLPETWSDEFIYKLIVPTSRSNPFWDAIQGKSIYQTTISRERAVADYESPQMKLTLRFIKMVCGEATKHEVVYVVPRHIFQDFKLPPDNAAKVATIPPPKMETLSLSKLLLKYVQGRIRR